MENESGMFVRSTSDDDPTMRVQFEIKILQNYNSGGHYLCLVLKK